MKRVLVMCVCVCFLSISVGFAQAPSPDPPKFKVPAQPTLTEVQKLQIINLLQSVELHRRAVQISTTSAEKAQDQLSKLVAEITPVGWQLNEKLEFITIPLKPEVKK